MWSLLTLPTVCSYAATKEVVFIDSAVPNSQLLINNIRPDVPVIRLEAGIDGVVQIANALLTHHGLDAVHLISHGAPGKVFLGNGELSSDNLNLYVKQLQSISDSLQRDGSLLVYGCNIAYNYSGREFIQDLRTSLQRHVAASTNQTGNNQIGGDWALEYHDSDSLPALPVAMAQLENYKNVLYYIDNATAPSFSPNISDLNGSGFTAYINSIASLPDGKIALLVTTYDADWHTEKTYVRVVNANGSIIFTADITSAMGSRATNFNANKIYGLSTGSIVVTWEGTTNGCDNNTSNLFQFIMLDASGNITKSATDISTGTASYNCYTGAAELSNGNLAFFYQWAGDAYNMRVFGSDGTAVTGAQTIPKPIACTSTYSHSIAANANGKFMMVSHCYGYDKYFGVLYNNDGTVSQVSGADTFDLSSVNKGGAAQSNLTALTDNNFVAVYMGEPGADHTSRDERYRLVQPNGTLGTEVIRQTVGNGYIGDIYGLKDGGFILRRWDGSTIAYADLYNNGGVAQETNRSLDSAASSGWYDFVTSGKNQGFLYYNDNTNVIHLYNFASTNTSPAFVGTTTTLTVNQNAGATDIKGLLHASDADSSQTLTWSQSVAPNQNGSLSFSSATASSGGTDITPGGTITYTPAPGFTGTESFTVQVSDGSLSATRQIVVTVSIASPTATTNSATAVTQASATLNGTVNAHGNSTSVTFDYGPTTSYGSTISATPSPVTGTSNTPVSASISGLECNTTYHFQVKGTSSGGTVTGADTTFTTSACVPGAPTIGTATAGSQQATVSFTAPSSNGGAAITGYTVTSDPEGLTGTGIASPITVLGLTNGISYTFTVTANNISGAGNASAPSNSVTPKANQIITFDNPGSQNFGTTPTVSASSNSGLPVAFSSTTTNVCTVNSTGVLAFLTTGTCTINADQAGNSIYLAASTANQSFTVNAVVPGTPTIGTATAEAGQALVSFSTPSFTGGASITGYTVTSNPGGITGTGTSSPITVSGLANGTAYTFTVSATNSAGTGNVSSDSNSVTPKANQSITFTNPGACNFGTIPTLSVSADSGLPISLSSGTTAVCAVTDSGVLLFLKAGTCTIHADQAGSNIYQAATRVTQSFSVNAVVPGAPINVIATAGDAQATIAFSPPSFTGGVVISHYTITSDPDGLTATGTTSPITIIDLNRDTTYTFTVTATNSVGTGPASLPSNSVTPKLFSWPLFIPSMTR